MRPKNCPVPRFRRDPRPNKIHPTDILQFPEQDLQPRIAKVSEYDNLLRTLAQATIHHPV